MSIENFATDTLATWSIFRGLGAVEDPFFDPTSGWDMGWGCPKDHLSLGANSVSIENFATDNLATWSIFSGLGAVENHFFANPPPPPQDGKLHGSIKLSYALERSLTLKQLYLGIDLEQTWMKRSKIN